MKLAVCIWDLKTPDETIRDLAANDLEFVELGPDFFMAQDEQTIRETTAKFEDAGISIFAGHAPFVGPEANLSSLNTAERQKAVENHKKMLHRAALAHSRHIVVHPGQHADLPDIPKMERLVKISLEELLPVAEETGVKLAVENMPPEYPCWSSRILRDLVEDFSSEWIGACFDTGHAHMGPQRGVAEAFKTLRDVIIAFHVHDNDGTWDRHMQPPYGTIDWVSFAKILKEVSFDDPISIEALPWTGSTWRTELREMEALFTSGQLLIKQNGRDIRPMCTKCGHYLFGTEGNSFCGCNQKGNPKH